MVTYTNKNNVHSCHADNQLKTGIVSACILFMWFIKCKNTKNIKTSVI